jgi:hypothetical protein
MTSWRLVHVGFFAVAGAAVCATGLAWARARRARENSLKDILNRRCSIGKSVIED